MSHKKYQLYEPSQVQINLRNVRKSLQVTQEEMARRLQMCHSNYSHYESGKYNLSDPMLEKCAKALNCTPDYIHLHHTLPPVPGINFYAISNDTAGKNYWVDDPMVQQAILDFAAAMRQQADATAALLKALAPNNKRPLL